MKKTALVLSLMMVMTLCLGVFASARTVPEVEAGNALFWLETVDGQTKYNKDDYIDLAVNITTGNEPFCYYKWRIDFDTTKVAVDFVAESTSELYTDYKSTKLKSSVINEDFKDQGYLITNMVDADNLTHLEGRKKVPTYDGTSAFIACTVLTDEPCDVTFNFTLTDMSGTDRPGESHDVPSTGRGLTLHLNGGAPVVSDPVVSLGAKINREKVALRFGATYNRMEEKGAVDELGMLLLPEELLAGKELDLDLGDDRVANLQAKGIVEYVSGQKFEDYGTFTYYCTVVGLAGHEDKAIVARPYIKYAGGEVAYAEAMARSYNDIANPVA